jgi:hypothetical protein
LDLVNACNDSTTFDALYDNFTVQIDVERNAMDIKSCANNESLQMRNVNSDNMQFDDSFVSPALKEFVANVERNFKETAATSAVALPFQNFNVMNQTHEAAFPSPSLTDESIDCTTHETCSNTGPVSDMTTGTETAIVNSHDSKTFGAQNLIGEANVNIHLIQQSTPLQPLHDMQASIQLYTSNEQRKRRRANSLINDAVQVKKIPKL